MRVNNIEEGQRCRPNRWHNGSVRTAGIRAGEGYLVYKLTRYLHTSEVVLQILNAFHNKCCIDLSQRKYPSLSPFNQKSGF